MWTCEDIAQASERSTGAKHRSIGARTFTRTRNGAENRSAGLRSGAEWNIGASERMISALVQHQSRTAAAGEQCQNVYDPNEQTCNRTSKRSTGASEQERLPGRALHSL
jgi:hypothetical protein